MPLIEIDKVSKTFGVTPQNRVPVDVVRNLSFRLEPGELVTMFGPNGCGKTTILNILAGLLAPDSGTIRKDRQEESDRSVGYVFQNYADTLLPWRSVQDNIALPLEFRRIPLPTREARVRKHMEEFRLTEHAPKYIYELSGGLKQLVAIARSTVYQPDLLLLDEPLSALDYSVSRMLWMRFREFWSHHQVTTVFVSHNVDEAVFLGDRVCVLSSRPAKIVADIAMPFGKQRSLDLLSSRQFFDARNLVLEAFEKGRNG